MLKENFTFISEEKINNRKFFKYICSNNHEGLIRKDHWYTGVRCSKCSGNSKLTLEYLRSEFLKEGYNLLSTRYRNSSSILETTCPNGHLYKVSWNNWYSGYRCSTCSNRHKKSIQIIYDSVCSQGYSIISTDYLNNKDKLKLKCPKGHIYEVSWDNWNSKGSRCVECSTHGTSKQEIELYTFIKSIIDGVVLHDREIIAPYELDIVVPSKKIAIEYCGLFWHSERMGKHKLYHSNKDRLCNKAGYRLITVFEDELVNKKDVVFSMLKTILNPSLLTTIHAKNCSIEYIDYQEAKTFCENNDIHDYTLGITHTLGAFYEGDLVGVMSFSELHSNKCSVAELRTFCIKADHQIVGLFSKMIDVFLKTNDGFSTILSNVDCRWSSGSLYRTNGFKLIGKTKPNCWYFKNNYKKLHRVALREKGANRRSQQAQGWNRIWDCGSLKYMWEKETTVNDQASDC